MLQKSFPYFDLFNAQVVKLKSNFVIEKLTKEWLGGENCKRQEISKYTIIIKYSALFSIISLHYYNAIGRIETRERAQRARVFR